jgi:hypothetical protein
MNRFILRNLPKSAGKTYPYVNLNVVILQSLVTDLQKLIAEIIGVIHNMHHRIVNHHSLAHLWSIIISNFLSFTLDLEQHQPMTGEQKKATKLTRVDSFVDSPKSMTL